ncbi:heme-binding protein 2 [Rhineura floridana]|uniref:heme-binding protein 2 n=1 Tax=Rhineura floridana TaxID=261503 RepID=UPI002AC83966|nr:heme-binding protein 2 [Rhineura floridana]
MLLHKALWPYTRGVRRRDLLRTVLTERKKRMLKSIKQALFSTGLEMPKWTALPNQAFDYEIRQYEPAKWVCTSVKTMDWDSAINTGFTKLFNYIKGKNEKGIKIDMTAPVTCYVQPGAGPFSESTTTVSFYVPSQHQANPPKPSEADVFIETRPAITVFVRSFGGFANAKKNQEEILALAESLKRDGRSFQEKVYYSAGYDSPFKLLNRHNEVWLIKKS